MVEQTMSRKRSKNSMSLLMLVQCLRDFGLLKALLPPGYSRWTGAARTTCLPTTPRFSRTVRSHGTRICPNDSLRNRRILDAPGSRVDAFEHARVLLAIKGWSCLFLRRPTSPPRNRSSSCGNQGCLVVFCVVHNFELRFV